MSNALTDAQIEAHLQSAALFLRQALHYHRFQPGSRIVVLIAMQAGERAAYSGIDYPMAAPACTFGLVAGQALDVPVIGFAFETQRLYTLATLAG